MRLLHYLRQFTVFVVVFVLMAGVATGPGAMADRATGNDSRFSDKTWDQVVNDFFTQHGVDPDAVGIAYYNTITGEEHQLNGDRYRFGAGLYKLPLNMYFAEKVFLGEMQADQMIGLWTYRQIQAQTLEHSNNELCELLQDYFQNYDQYLSAIRTYLAAPNADFDQRYTTRNYFTPAQMLRCFKFLVSEPDRFPDVLEHLKNSENNGFFRQNENRYTIAHNHGYYYQDGLGTINDSAIIYTDEPFVLVMMTEFLAGNVNTLADFCVLMCDYTQYWSQQHAAEDLAAYQAEEAAAANATAEAEAEAARAAAEALALAEAFHPERETTAENGVPVGQMQQPFPESDAPPLSQAPEPAARGEPAASYDTEIHTAPSGTTRKEIITIILIVLAFLAAILLIRSVKRASTGAMLLILIAMLLLTAAGCGRTPTASPAATDAMETTQSPTATASAPAPSRTPAGTGEGEAASAGKDPSAATVEPVSESVPAAPVRTPAPPLMPIVTLTGETVEEIAALSGYRGLEYVDATASRFYDELVQAQKELPNVLFNWVVDIGGNRFHSTDTYLYLTDSSITQEELSQKLRWLPSVEMLDITGLDWPNEQSAALAEAFPNMKVRWSVHMPRFTVPNDITCFSSLQWDNDPRYPLEDYLPLLTYCKDLVALDLGHNDITDVTMIGELTKLKVLILADNPHITDLSPLANLTELEYLECFMNYDARDFSFLDNMPHMRDLNLCWCSWLSDTSFLDNMPDLQYCWMHNTSVGWWNWDAIQNSHPNVTFLFQIYGSNSSTARGWRATPDNLAIRQAFTYWKDVVEFRDIYDVTFREGVYIPQVDPAYS